MRFRYILALIVALALTDGAKAQNADEQEYRLELGAGLNLTSYQGDFSDALFGRICAGGSVISRWILNPRSAVRLGLMVTKIRGQVENSNTYYPDLMPTDTQEGYSFSNVLGDFSVSYEYNFLPYGTGRDYRGAKRFTPFVSLGIGLTYVNSSGGTFDYSSGTTVDGVYIPSHSSSSSVVTGNIPIGVGVKYRLGARLNLSLEWQMHISFSDKLDGVKDPYRISSSGIFKNTDCYSGFVLGVTYSLAPRCVTCHNDR